MSALRNWCVLAFPICLLAVGCNGRTGRLDPALTSCSTWEQYCRLEAQAEDGRAAEFQLPANPGLRDCLTYAALHSPGLKAAFHRWQAAVEKIEQVRTLPDPKFTYAYYFLEVETRVGPQRQSFSLAQTFPWFGKLQLRGDAAALAAKVKWHLFQNEKLKLYARVAAAYCDYYYLGHAVSITRDNVKLLEQLERLVRTRYKIAAASHPDLIRLQVKLGELADRLASLKEMRRPTLARLNAAMGRAEPAGELPWPKSIPHEPVAAERARLLEWMNQSNPALAAMDAELAAARKRIALAKKNYWPDVTLAGTFIDTRDRVGASPSDSGQDAVIGMVTLNVPIWREKLAAGVREARHRSLAASARRAQAAKDLSAELAQALFQLQDARRKMGLYRRALVPKARESLNVTQRGFAAGTSTFNDLIDAQRILLEFELSYQSALANHAKWRAELERVVGRPLPAERNRAPVPDVDKGKL